MKKLLSCASLLTLALPFTCVTADVEIQMQAPGGLVTTFSIGTDKVKMATQDNSGFVIVDVTNQQQFLIDHNEGMVIDVTNGFTGANDAAPAKQQPAEANISITKVADGPSIAGFSSNQYEIKANGEICSTEYLSTDPLKHPEITQLLKVMELLGESDIGNKELYSPCEQAELTLERQYQTHGIPLRSVSASGEVISEVINFEIKELPASTYAFPDGYTLTTIRQLMQEQMDNMTTPPNPH